MDAREIPQPTRGQIGAIGAAMTRFHQRFSTPILLASFLLSIASLIVTNVWNAAFIILQWVMIPFFAAAMIWPMAWLPERGIATPPLAWLSRSSVLRCVLVYLAALVVATWLRADASADVVRHDAVWAMKRSIEIVLFLGITGYLATVYPQFFRIVFLVMAGLLAIKAVIDIVDLVRFPKETPFLANRLEGTIGTPGYRSATHLAPLFAIYGLGALALLTGVGTRHWEKLVIGVSSTILFAAVVLTQARGGLAVALIGIALILAASRLRFKWAFLGIVAAGVLVLLSRESVWQIIFQRGDSFRFALAEAYLRLAMDKPWFGYGIGQQIIVNLKSTNFEQPHNMYVWAQLRGGVFANVALLALVASSLIATFIHWRRIGNLAPLAVAAAFAVTGLTEIGLLVSRYDWIWLTFWLPVGLAAGAELTVKARGLAPASEPHATR